MKISIILLLVLLSACEKSKTTIVKTDCVKTKQIIYEWIEGKQLQALDIKNQSQSVLLSPLDDEAKVSALSNLLEASIRIWTVKDLNLE